MALGAFESSRLLLGGDRLSIFTPASVDPRLARLVAESRGTAVGLKRFTPAGVDSRASRTLTVAVRVDAENARAIQVRSAIQAAQDNSSDGGPGIAIASTRYNLGLARGYQGFAQSAPRTAVAGRLAPALSASVVPTRTADAAIPDLAEFRPSPGVAREESRFAARISEQAPGLAGPRISAPQTIGAEQTVDLAGSYRLTRNLDVTAGVRYSQDRDRLTPLPPAAERDNQAVYIGTQFRF